MLLCVCLRLSRLRGWSETSLSGALCSLSCPGLVHPACQAGFHLEFRGSFFPRSFLFWISLSLLPTGILFTFSSSQTRGASLGLLAACATALQRTSIAEACPWVRAVRGGGKRGPPHGHWSPGTPFPTLLSRRSSFSQNFACPCRYFSVRLPDLDPLLGHRRIKKTSEKNGRLPTHVHRLFIFFLLPQPTRFLPPPLPSHFSESSASRFCVLSGLLVVVNWEDSL